MATLTATSSGKATAAIWGGAKFAEGDDLIVPTGISVEWNAAAKIPRSIEFQTGSKMTGSGELKVGAATAQESAKCVTFAPGAEITWTGELRLESTSSTKVKVALGGHKLAETIKFRLAGKYEALESPKTAKAFAVESAVLEFVCTGQTMEATRFEFASAGIINLENTTAKHAGESFGTTSFVEAATLALTGFVLEVSSGGLGEQKVAAPGKQLPTVTLRESATVTLQNMSGITTLNIAPGVTVLVKPSAKPKWATVNCTATEGSPATIESSEAGNAEVTVTEQETLGWVKLKAITVLTGVWYLPKGSEAGGAVKTIGTTVKFEAKPGGGTVFTDSMSGTIKLAGTKTETVALVDSQSGTISIKGTAADVLAFVETRTGTLSLKGTAVFAETHASTVQGRITLTGSSSFAEAHTSTVSGRITLTGTATDVFTHGYADTATGTIHLTGSSTFAETHAATPIGRITLTGSAVESYVVPGGAELAVTITVTSRKNLQIQTASRKNLSIAPSSRKQLTIGAE